MKAHLQRANTSVLLAHDIYPGQVKQMEEYGTGTDRVKSQFLACSDDATRLARVKMLKAQVDAGTYSIDSKVLALKILNSPVMRTLPNHKENDISHITQEGEPHE